MDRSCCVISTSPSEGSVYVIQENGGNLFGPQTRSEAVHTNVAAIKQRSANCIRGLNLSNKFRLTPSSEASTLDKATGIITLVMMTNVASKKERDDSIK